MQPRGGGTQTDEGWKPPCPAHEEGGTWLGLAVPLAQQPPSASAPFLHLESIACGVRQEQAALPYGL